MGGGMMLEQICDWIILLGAVSVALLNIIKFFAKPTSFLKRKKHEEFQNNLKKALDKIMPTYFEDHDLETRDKYLNDRKRYLEEITQEVLNNTKDVLEEIKEMNIEQSENLRILNQGSKDVLRQKIMSIYHQYKKEQRMPIYAKEALDELYKDYKAQGGNSYIDKYYKRMSLWEVYLEDEDDE